jgi:hypothetical protein
MRRRHATTAATRFPRKIGGCAPGLREIFNVPAALAMQFLQRRRPAAARGARVD